MIIRPAQPGDAQTITELLYIAMDTILFEFIQQKSETEAKKFLHHFVSQENNQYSWQNCFVGEHQDIVVCALNIYNGRDLELLRNPVVAYVRENYNAGFNPENETQAGEYYLDSVGVSPKAQGAGFGTKMLEYVIYKFTEESHSTVGLLVDVDNPRAKQLYTKLGFEPVGFKTLAGKTLEHMQIG